MVWDIIFLSSFMCWINDVIKTTSYCNVDWKLTIQIIIFHLIITLYIFYFWKKGYVFEDIRKTEKGKLENSQENEYKEDCEKYVKNKI